MEDNDVKMIARAANAVWQEIGDDVLHAAGGTIPRDEVIEVVVDADRLLERLRYMARKDQISDSCIAEYQSLSYEELQRFLAEHAFKYEYYGW